MPKTNSTPLNYRLLLLTAIKEKSLSLTIGVILILLISTVIFQQFITNLKPLTTNTLSAENGQTKNEVKNVNKTDRTYIVQSGDKLFVIAEKIYGSGLNMEDIMKANNITDPNLLKVGQKLIIPDVKSKFPTTGEVSDTAANTDQVTLKGEKYVVKEGDTLASIALQAYGDSYSWQKIADANNLLNPDDLAVGTTLIIPK